jgi:hypothetical protein
MTQAGSFKTVTVTYSWPLASSDGSTALLLDTLESGAIAFRVDAKSIALLRRQLADCEAILNRRSATAQ